MRLRAWWLPAAILAAFLVADSAREILLAWTGLRGLYAQFPFWVAGGLVSLAHIAWSLLVVALLCRSGPAAALGALGFRGSLPKGLLFAAMATLPLGLTFVLAMPLAREFEVPAVVYLTILSPLAEETVYRALAFGQLRRLAGWGFWPAALLPAALFAWSHLNGGESSTERIGILAITGLGSLFFSWLYERWGFNLWVPFGLHFLMNLSWSVFSVGDSAFAGWLPTVLQATTLVAAWALTRYRERVPGLRSAGPSSSGLG